MMCMQRYTNSSNNVLNVFGIEALNGLKETKIATLAVGDYNNPLGDGLNYLADIVYRTEEVYTTTEVPETGVDYFWVHVDQVYFEKAKQIPNQVCSPFFLFSFGYTSRNQHDMTNHI